MQQTEPGVKCRCLDGRACPQFLSQLRPLMSKYVTSKTDQPTNGAVPAKPVWRQEASWKNSSDLFSQNPEKVMKQDSWSTTSNIFSQVASMLVCRSNTDTVSVQRHLLLLEKKEKNWHLAISRSITSFCAFVHIATQFFMLLLDLNLLFRRRRSNVQATNSRA